MSEYIDVYISSTTKVPEDATEFDYELFERFTSGGPWVAHSEYMKLKDDNAKLRELVRDVVLLAGINGCDVTEMQLHAHGGDWRTVCERMRELGVEVDE